MDLWQAPVLDPQQCQVTRLLGQGGFALVFYATLHGAARGNTGTSQAALKLLRPNHRKTEKHAERLFIAEACSCLGLLHKNLVRCLGLYRVPAHFPGVGPLPEATWGMLLEYCEGGTLRDRVTCSMRSGRRSYSDEAALGWLLDVAEALRFLHAATPPLIHRDIKAENVLLQAKGAGAGAQRGAHTAKLADMGLHVRIEEDRSVMLRRKVAAHDAAATAAAPFIAIAPAAEDADTAAQRHTGTGAGGELPQCARHVDQATSTAIHSTCAPAASSHPGRQCEASGAGEAGAAKVKDGATSDHGMPAAPNAAGRLLHGLGGAPNAVAPRGGGGGAMSLGNDPTALTPGGLLTAPAQAGRQLRQARHDATPPAFIQPEGVGAYPQACSTAGAGFTVALAPAGAGFAVAAVGAGVSTAPCSALSSAVPSLSTGTLPHSAIVSAGDRTVSADCLPPTVPWDAISSAPLPPPLAGGTPLGSGVDGGAAAVGASAVGPVEYADSAERAPQLVSAGSASEPEALSLIWMQAQPSGLQGADDDATRAQLQDPPAAIVHYDLLASNPPPPRRTPPLSSPALPPLEARGGGASAAAAGAEHRGSSTDVFAGPSATGHHAGDVPRAVERPAFPCTLLSPFSPASYSPSAQDGGDTACPPASQPGLLGVAAPSASAAAVQGPFHSAPLIKVASGGQSPATAAVGDLPDSHNGRPAGQKAVGTKQEARRQGAPNATRATHRLLMGHASAQAVSAARAAVPAVVDVDRSLPQHWPTAPVLADAGAQSHDRRNEHQSHQPQNGHLVTRSLRSAPLGGKSTGTGAGAARRTDTRTRDAAAAAATAAPGAPAGAASRPGSVQSISLSLMREDSMRELFCRASGTGYANGGGAGGAGAPAATATSAASALDRSRGKAVVRLVNPVSAPAPLGCFAESDGNQGGNDGAADDWRGGLAPTGCNAEGASAGASAGRIGRTACGIDASGEFDAAEPYGAISSASAASGDADGHERGARTECASAPLPQRVPGASRSHPGRPASGPLLDPAYERPDSRAPPNPAGAAGGAGAGAGPTLEVSAESFRQHMRRVCSMAALLNTPSGALPEHSEFQWVYGLTGQAGSCMYMAPEVFMRQPYNAKCDVFGFGVLMYELWSHELLLYAYQNNAQAERLGIRAPRDYARKVSEGFRPPRPRRFSDAQWDLVSRCWHQDPCERPGMAEVAERLRQMQGTGGGDNQASSSPHVAPSCGCSCVIS